MQVRALWRESNFLKISTTQNYIDTHWPPWEISYQCSKGLTELCSCPQVEAGHQPSGSTDCLTRPIRKGSATKTHRNIQFFYPFHKDFLCHKLTNNFWQLTYVFDNSNAEPLKSSTNREACIEQTATNEETLEVEYLTGQLCAFYPIQNTLKLSVLNCWS